MMAVENKNCGLKYLSNLCIWRQTHLMHSIGNFRKEYFRSDSIIMKITLLRNLELYGRLRAANKLSLDIVWWFYKPNSALYNQLPFRKLFSKFTVVVNILLSLYKELTVYQVEIISDILHSHGWSSQAQSHM